MASGEFLYAVEKARNITLFHFLSLSSRRGPLSPEREASDLARLRALAPAWLAPRVVAGFDAADFPDLARAQQDSLATAVASYAAVADAVAGREPTDGELKQAIGHWATILGVLDEANFDQEGKTILAGLVAAKDEFPDFVLGIGYTLDTDWSGDPGIWLWVITTNEADADTDDFRRFASWCPRAAWNAITRSKSQRLPYVRYRLLSDAIEPKSEEVV